MAFQGGEPFDPPLERVASCAPYISFEEGGRYQKRRLPDSAEASA